MKIIGLFLTVFIGVVLGRALGLSESAICIGAVVGAGTYIITTFDK